jgi:flagellar hook protein FlgE
MIDFTIPVAGLDRAAASLNQVAQKIAGIGGSSAHSINGSDTIDLSAAAVAMIEAKNSFQANTQVIRTGDQMTKALLNVLG